MAKFEKGAFCVVEESESFNLFLDPSSPTEDIFASREEAESAARLAKEMWPEYRYFIIQVIGEAEAGPEVQ